MTEFVSSSLERELKKYNKLNKNRTEMIGADKKGGRK